MQHCRLFLTAICCCMYVFCASAQNKWQYNEFAVGFNTLFNGYILPNNIQLNTEPTLNAFVVASFVRGKKQRLAVKVQQFSALHSPENPDGETRDRTELLASYRLNVGKFFIQNAVLHATGNLPGVPINLFGNISTFGWGIAMKDTVNSLIVTQKMGVSMTYTNIHHRASINNNHRFDLIGHYSLQFNQLVVGLVAGAKVLEIKNDQPDIRRWIEFGGEVAYRWPHVWLHAAYKRSEALADTDASRRIPTAGVKFLF